MTDDDVRRIPFSRIRKTIRQRMQQSVSTKPQVTLFACADATRLSRAREEVNERGRDRPGFPLSYTQVLLKVLATVLADAPGLNGWVEEDDLVLSRHVDICVATATPRGLLAPVLRDVQDMPMSNLATAYSDLVGRAQRGKLAPDDMTGGTFTVTNLGSFGITHFTPLINPPQIAILGIGRIGAVTGARSGGVESGRVLPLSLTFDHSAIDGADAATFLQLLCQTLEHVTSEEIMPVPS